jgi:hypothetical protein
MEVQITSEGLGWSHPFSLTEPCPAVMSTREVLHQRSWARRDDEPDTSSTAAASNQTRFETVCSSSPLAKGRGRLEWISTTASQFTTKLRRLDPIKLAYLRTSFVFAISVLVTWAPSSINRVYSLIYPGRVSFGLNLASAVVLPLQGVWNAVIYFSTSWGTFRDEIKRLMLGCKARRQDSRVASRVDGATMDILRGEQRNGFERARFERGKAIINGEISGEFELSSPIGTVRAMQGSF